MRETVRETRYKLTPKQMNESGKRIRQAKEHFDMTTTTMAEFCGINEAAASNITRNLPTGMSFINVVRVCLAMDIDPFELIQILDADSIAKEHMHDPKYRDKYVNLRWLVEGSGKSRYTLLSELCEHVPENNKKLVMDLIRDVLDRFEK